MKMMDSEVRIDGSQGEGGGQVLRTSLSLSAAYGKPFEMQNIRAKRDKPGLKRQHLTCVRAVAQICGAQVEGDEVGSMRLSFKPGKIKGGTYQFDIGTAGSVMLVAQTVIPVLLRADVPSTVTITGGTHVPFAPIWEFFSETYLPELRRMGARVEAQLEQCGFYPAAGGVVKLRIWPYDEAKGPARYELTDLGAYKGGTVEGVVSHISRSIAEAEVGIVGNQLRDLALERVVREVDALGPGNYCCARLRYDRATVVISAIGTYGKSRKAVANEVAHQIRDFVKSGKACERHLADQLLVPLHLFIGGYETWDGGSDRWIDNWNLAIQEETSHYTTNEQVISAF
ncbi:MAG: RNA 3'-phosphate cyclase [Kiritimatiellae bacterium]|nr:RNA 3'-phosphate cyclase [Kiritimatiellia bacterium]